MFWWYYLNEKLWNNIFCFDENKPLWITEMIEWNILDAKKWKKRVFREKNENISTGSLPSQGWHKLSLEWENYVWLENCILQKRTLWNWNSQFIFLVDNHNWALWCWKYAIDEWIIKNGAKLLHIDQHSDMNDNWYLKGKKGEKNGEKRNKRDRNNFEKTVIENTTIANFIKPAIDLGIISEVELVLTEYKLLQTPIIPLNRGKISGNIDQISCPDKGRLGRVCEKTSKEGFFIEDGILDIDLDFWDKRAGYENLDKHKKIIQDLISRYPVITIATSPCFIDQEYALELLNWLFGE